MIGAPYTVKIAPRPDCDARVGGRRGGDYRVFVLPALPSFATCWPIAVRRVPVCGRCGNFLGSLRDAVGVDKWRMVVNVRWAHSISAPARSCTRGERCSVTLFLPSTAVENAVRLAVGLRRRPHSSRSFLPENVADRFMDCRGAGLVGPLVILLLPARCLRTNQGQRRKALVLWVAFLVSHCGLLLSRPSAEGRSSVRRGWVGSVFGTRCVEVRGAPIYCWRRLYGTRSKRLVSIVTGQSWPETCGLYYL